jgi:signal transduction histidine kinase
MAGGYCGGAVARVLRAGPASVSVGRVNGRRVPEPQPVIVVAPGQRRRSQTVLWRRVLVGVVLAALVGGVLVGAAATIVARSAAEAFAVRNAAADTATAARALVEPALRDALADPSATTPERVAAASDLARAARRATEGTSAVRVKVWSEDGTILWSDEPRLVGERFDLSDDDLAALRSDRSDADVSDLDEPENRYERGDGPLLEAYQAVHLPSGQPLLFEVYYRYDAVIASADRLRAAFTWLALGAVAVVLGLLVPLILVLLVRIRAGQQERERLLIRALDAQTTERRRIAAELHDGAVQDIAGVALSLGADADGPTSRAAGALRSAVSTLRTALAAVQPAHLHAGSLAAAVADACRPARAAGIDVAVSIDDPLPVSDGAVRTVVRFVRETVANATKHADASQVTVAVTSSSGAGPSGTGGPGRLVASVTDDGAGFDPLEVLAQSQAGHLGATLLRQLAEDARGGLTLTTAPGHGTRWVLTLPEDAESAW